MYELINKRNKKIRYPMTETERPPSFFLNCLFVKNTKTFFLLYTPIHIWRRIEDANKSEGGNEKDWVTEERKRWTNCFVFSSIKQQR